MDAAWPDGEEHMAKLSVNAMIGLWARSTEVVYSVRSSSSELDGAGADFSQAFAYEGGMVWDFVYARRLLSNGIHDAVLGFEHCMVAKARRILDAQVKTDCLLTAAEAREALRQRALEALRHPDGTPVYRVEETKPLLGSRAPRMEAERPKQRRWNGVDDPISHCLAGNSLLLTGLPGTGKTYLARTIVARLREQGEAVHLVSKTHCSAQNLGLKAQTADHWVRRYVRGGSAQKLDWLVVEEITQLDMALWADLACVGLNADVKFLLLGDFRQLPAVLDSQLREVAAGRRGGVPHAGAGQGEAEGALPLQARVAGHHAGHQPQQAHGRERSGEPRPSHPHRFGVLRSGNTWVYCNTKQPAEQEGVAGAAPHWGRRKDTQGGLCGRGGSGAGWSEAGQRHAADAAPPVRGRLTGHELRAAGGLERAARRLQGLQHEVAHLKEHAPLPGHQPHVPGLHKRAALRRANSAGAARGCRPGPRRGSTLTARCSWLSSSVRAAPWKTIMLSMTPCSTSSVHSSRSVLLAKHTPTLLAPSSWKLPGSHSTSTSALHTSAP